MRMELWRVAKRAVEFQHPNRLRLCTRGEERQGDCGNNASPEKRKRALDLDLEGRSEEEDEEEEEEEEPEGLRLRFLHVLRLLCAWLSFLIVS